MFLLYVFGVFAITLLALQGQVQAQDQPFECYSWGDPHVQTWHAKNDGQIRNRDCYAPGDHTLVSNKYINFQVHIKNLLTIEANVEFYDGQTDEVICHIHLKNFDKAPSHHQCEKNGITLTTVSSGARATFNIAYPAASLFLSIREEGSCPNSCYYNIFVWQPQSLIDLSTGICSLADNGCSQRALGTDALEWEPVRSSVRRQFITNEQAKSICSQYVDAFFVQTRRAPYQRNANLNSTIASVLAGCVDDVVLTGRIEMAQGAVDVLMMKELTHDATSIDSIRTAVQSGIEAASSTLNDAVRMAEVGIRKIL